MPISKSQRAAIRRAITRFGSACEEYAFRGSIPVGESIEAELAVKAIEDEYALSRERLEALIERYVAEAKKPWTPPSVRELAAPPPDTFEPEREG